MQNREERLEAENNELRTARNEVMAESSARTQRLMELASLLNEAFPDEQPDVAAFGRGAWVYCSQHMKPHQTGWCGVSVRDKIGLGVKTAQEAYQKCRDWKLPLYQDLDNA